LNRAPLLLFIKITSTLFNVSTEKIKVAVIYGGSSSEREVSLNSGKNIIKYLPRDKYEVVPLEVAIDGTWAFNDLSQFDVVFIGLHGTYGEDGQIQAGLDEQGVKYTGSGAVASKLAFNKYLSSQTVSKAGLQIPKQQLITNPTELTMQPPFVVKPNNNGSSVAVTIVTKQSQIKKALNKAFAVDKEVLIEEYITGRELTCGILGDQPLPSVEIIPTGKFFDYEAKYNSPNTQEICPANIGPEIERLVQKKSLQAHQILGCHGLTRSDFILDKNNNLFYLETNTLPGLTDASLCPKEAKAAGINFSDFLDRQIELALQNKSKR